MSFIVRCSRTDSIRIDMDPSSLSPSSMSLELGGAAKTSERKTKRRKTAPPEDDKPPPSRWKNAGDQRIYSSNLLHALRRVRRSSSSLSSSSSNRSLAVREAADRVLATAARGRTRWSHAILLSHRRTLKIKAARRRFPRKPAVRKRSASVAAAAVAGEGGVALERKAKVLGRLVPGCRKLPFSTLLDEATDYIAALEMQVRAMSALADILSSVGVRDAAAYPATEDGAASSSSS